MAAQDLDVPLLIVNGNFQTLSKMSIEDLETFIPFMTDCSVKRSKAKMINGIPEWWPRTICYKFPLKKPKGLSDLGYRKHMQSLICRCYCYHNAHYLLALSSKISRSPELVFLRNNENSTTSVYSVETTAHILTFDNENWDYDKKLGNKEKPTRRSLLPVQTNKMNDGIIADIYLCENCDVEFYSLADMERHEKKCYGTPIEDLSDEIQIITHIKPKPFSLGEQEGFLSYLYLCSKAGQSRIMDGGSSKKSVEAPVKRWVILNMCLHKNRKIEFSSLLGRKMLEHRARRDIVNRIEQSIAMYESHCSTEGELKPGNENFKPKLTYKKSKKIQASESSHFYCFTKRERIEKIKTIETGLNHRSRKLLEKCKKCKVFLRKLMLPKADLYILVRRSRNLSNG